MIQCRICGCYCDPSDTANGVCDDCREEKQRKENSKAEVERMIESEFQQMRLDILEETENG